MRMKIKRSKGVSDDLVSTEMFRHVLSEEEILKEKRLEEHAAKMKRMSENRTLFVHKGETFYDLRGQGSRYLHSIDARGIRFSIPRDAIAGIQDSVLPELPKTFSRHIDRDTQRSVMNVFDEIPRTAYTYIVLDPVCAEALKRNSYPHNGHRRQPWIEPSRIRDSVHKIFTFGEFETGETVLRVASASWVQDGLGNVRQRHVTTDHTEPMQFTDWRDRKSFINSDDLRRATIDPDEVEWISRHRL